MDPLELPQIRHSEGDSCPECKAGKLVENQDAGELHCKSCGYVALERLEDSSARSSFDEQLVYSKADSPIKTSLIDPKNIDFRGKGISPNMKYTMYRLRQWDKRSLRGDDRALKSVITTIIDWSDKLDLNPNATNDAINFFKRCRKLKVTDFKNLNELAIRSIIYSCRVNNIPRSENQFLAVSKMEKRMLRRNVRRISKITKDLKVFAPQDYLPMLANRLHMPLKISTLAISIIKKAEEQKLLFGKNPLYVAAISIYFAARIEKIPVPPSKLTEVSGMSPHSLKSYRELFRDTIIPMKNERRTRALQKPQNNAPKPKKIPILPVKLKNPLSYNNAKDKKEYEHAKALFETIKKRLIIYNLEFDTISIFTAMNKVLPVSPNEDSLTRFCGALYAASKLNLQFIDNNMLAKAFGLEYPSLGITPEKVDSEQLKIVQTLHLKIPAFELEKGVHRLANQIGLPLSVKNEALKSLSRVDESSKNTNPVQLLGTLLYNASMSENDRNKILTTLMSDRNSIEQNSLMISKKVRT